MKLMERLQTRRRDRERVGEPETPQKFPKGPEQPWWVILSPLWITVLMAVGFLLLFSYLLR